jgi:hypothetical protein
MFTFQKNPQNPQLPFCTFKNHSKNLTHFSLFYHGAKSLTDKAQNIMVFSDWRPISPRFSLPLCFRSFGEGVRPVLFAFWEIFVRVLLRVIIEFG